MADSENKNPNGSTGPTSPQGKATSSRNALKHGLCSQELILPNENAAEFEEVKEKWLSDCNFDEPLLITLAEQVAVAEWFHRRALREYNHVRQHLYEMQPDFLYWTPDEIKLHDRYQRYLTTRERAFNRASANYERFHNDCRRIYQEGNQVLEKAYELVKANPELADEWVRKEFPIRLPRRFLSTVVLNHPLRPDQATGPSESPPGTPH